MANKEPLARDAMRLNTDVLHTPLIKEKLTGEQLIELTQFCTEYAPFTSDLLVMDTKILTIKQFCMHLAREMSYHRELDKIEES